MVVHSDLRPRLPVELIHEILAHFVSIANTPSNYLQCRMVSHSFNAILQREACANPTIRIKEKWPDLPKGHKPDYDDFALHAGVPMPFEAYSAALSQGLLDCHVIKHLTLVGSSERIDEGTIGSFEHFTTTSKVTFYRPHYYHTIHACTLLRIVHQLPNIKEIVLKWFELSPCPHSPQCGQPAGPFLPKLDLFKLNNVRLEQNDDLQGLTHFHLFTTFMPATIRLEQCPWRSAFIFPVHYPQFSVPRLICDLPANGLLNELQSSAGVRFLRLWHHNRWQEKEVGAIIGNNLTSLQTLVLGATDYSGLYSHSATEPHDLKLSQCSALRDVTLAVAVGDVDHEGAHSIWDHLEGIIVGLPRHLSHLTIVFVGLCPDEDDPDAWNSDLNVTALMRRRHFAKLAAFLRNPEFSYTLRLHLDGHMSERGWSTIRYGRRESVLTSVSRFFRKAGVRDDRVNYTSMRGFIDLPRWSEVRQRDR